MEMLGYFKGNDMDEEFERHMRNIDRNLRIVEFTLKYIEAPLLVILLVLVIYYFFQ